MRMKEWIGKHRTDPQERSSTAKMKDKVENEELNPGQQLLRRNHILSNKLQRFNTGLAPNVLYRTVCSKVGSRSLTLYYSSTNKGNASEFKALLHPLQ